MRSTGHRVKEAIRLHMAEEISLGRAAELAGMNYFLFEELLRQQGISAMAPEVRNEIESVQREIADQVLA